MAKRRLGTMSPKDRTLYIQMAAEATESIMPDGSQFVLIVYDDDAELAEWATSLPTKQEARRLMLEIATTPESP
jgi:c-di-GMP-binding flagellar brake protein YcgR